MNSYNDNYLTNPIHVTAGRNLASMREERGITQQQLSDRLGIDSHELAALEAGKIPIGGKLIVALCDLFDEPVSAFFRPPPADNDCPAEMCFNDKARTLFEELSALADKKRENSCKN